MDKAFNVTSSSGNQRQIGSGELSPVSGKRRVKRTCNAHSQRPIEIPSETPAEVPDDMPTEIPVEEPPETPAEPPVEEPAEIPVEVPVEEPVEVPTNAVQRCTLPEELARLFAQLEQSDAEEILAMTASIPSEARRLIDSRV